MKDNNKTFLKENQKLVIQLILMTIIGIISIFADFWLKIINNSLNELIVILFSTVTVIVDILLFVILAIV